MSWAIVAVTGASVAGGAYGAKQAKKAAKTQAASADAAGKVQAESAEAAITEQSRQFDDTQESMQPWMQAGGAALDKQRVLMGLGSSQQNDQSNAEQQQSAFDQFNLSPGQQFLRDRAQKNLLRNESAIGGISGGNIRNALVQQGVGFAQQDFDNQFNRLGQMAGQGRAATTNTGQFGVNAAGNIGKFRANAAGNISQGLMAAGNARASGLANQSNAWQNAIGGVANLAGQYFGGQTPPPSSFGNQFLPSSGTRSGIIK